MELRVYLEVTDKRVFACAEDWPGWSRSGRTEEAALAALLASADRYRALAPALAVGEPLVTDRLAGDATTAFGAPGKVPPCDVGAPVPPAWLEILERSWELLDDVAAAAPAELRKGPRGGGRDRDKVVQHVVSAERSYARQVGVKHREPAFDDRAAVAAMRSEIVSALRDGAASEAKWPPRYFVRRTAWHVLDHAWEIQDRST
jgi:hypothetical protein